MWPEKTTRGSMCHYQGSLCLEQDQVRSRSGLILFYYVDCAAALLRGIRIRAGVHRAARLIKLHLHGLLKIRQGRCTRALCSLHLFLFPTTPKMALEVRPFGGMREQEQVESAYSVLLKGSAITYTDVA
jgi:hypothetical protein